MADQQKSPIEQAIHDFKRSAEITRDVRFQANIRLAGRARASAYVVSFLSTYVIALSLIPNILQLHTFQSQILLSCSVVLSVFVIFTSLIDGSQNFHHHAELLHSCARKIATIHHDLKLIDTSDHAAARSELRELEARYQRALDECPVNHDNVDFYKEMATKPHLFPEQVGRLPRVLFTSWCRFRVQLLKNGWLAPHLLVTIAISAIVYVFVLRSATFQ